MPGFVWIILAVVDILLILSVIFLERTKPQIAVSWSIILLALPFFGFLLYMMFGGNLSVKTQRMLKRKSIRGKEFKQLIENQKIALMNDKIKLDAVEQKYKQLIFQNLNLSDSILSQNNQVKIYNDGTSKFNALLHDIDNAKKCINICYYIFATDTTGMLLLKKLIHKANQGVEVNLLIDSVGSLKSNRKELKKLVRAGGKVAEFFPPLFGFRMFNFRINYRNHRKIVVIDNQIGYVGGVNIRDDHMGKDRRLYPWTDLHLRIEGDSVMELQKTFLRDWRYAYNKPDFDEYYLNRFFERSNNTQGTSGVQIVSSGPDDDKESIKKAMVRMILSAKKSVIIESPYFVPDDSFMEAIRIAVASKVEVNLVLPRLADHKSVYYCSLSYLRELALIGVNIYLKRGFLHSKCLIVDGEVATVGTCNADIRSFQLNFEVNAIIYDRAICTSLCEIYENDRFNSIIADKAWFNNLPIRVKFLKSFWRLFSAIM